METTHKWRINVKNLIASACGKESEHYKDFIESEKTIGSEIPHKKFILLKAIFLAAKGDYLGGYLATVKNLVQAELFDDELEQAKELLKNDYYVAAAVIAGAVLETRMRELCKEKEVAIGKLNKMNDDLTKNGIYTSLIQKQITALAAIRNSAAHGKYDEFSKDDVVNMIKQIETLLAYNFNI